MLRIITARQRVESRLRKITEANGYGTDIGQTVYTGWPRHLLLGRQIEPPLLALHPTSESRDSGQRRALKCTRELVAELIVDQHETAADWLDQALHDIRSALVTIAEELAGVVSVETGTVDWGDLADSESYTPYLRLTVPISITYTDRYGGTQP